MGKVTITGLDMSVATKDGQPPVDIRYDGTNNRVTVADKNLNFDAAALPDVITGLERLRQEVRPARATN